MFQCMAGCKAECCGNVPISKLLIKRRRNKIHRRYEKIELGNGLIHPVTVDHYCIFLDKQFHCDIYKERPFVCKMYGTIEELQCPYIDINGKKRTEEETIQVRNDIKRSVEERFFQYEMKYLKGLIMLPPFI